MRLKLDTPQSLKARVNLASFIGDFTSLRRAGHQLVGRCPLHPDRHPSFYVHPVRQVFYCFGCQHGGDLFTFVQTLRGCGFPEALGEIRRLAETKVFAEPKARLLPAKQAGHDSWKPQRGDPKPILIDLSPRDIPPCFLEGATRADVRRYQMVSTKGVAR
jgi:DNA primase